MSIDSRIRWLDISKGIAILLMIVGHTSIPKGPSNFIWAFHMPLFFLASGWSTSWDKYTVGAYVIKKLKALAIPFLVYSTIVVLLAQLIGKDSITWLGVLQHGWGGYALWFVPVLLMALILSRLVKQIPQKRIQITVSILLVVLGCLLNYYSVSLPWTLSAVPYATFLILLGSWLKDLEKYIENPVWWVMLVCFFITAMISHYWKLDLAWNQIRPVILLTIGAVSGTMMTFTLSSFISKWFNTISNILQAIGKETFIILAFSQIMGPVVQFYFPCNKVIEYLLVFLSLFIIVLIKNGVNKLVGYKIL